MSAENIRNTYRRQGAQAERERNLELIKSYYCGEPGCTKHPANMADLILRIKGEK